MFLGEPGIGKSKTLEKEFDDLRGPAHDRGDKALWFDLRDYSSEERLERKIFNCDEILQWRKGRQTLHLFLDSLDEGLLRIDSISRALLLELKDLPIERLRLRIASRPAEWQATLETGFLELWGADKVKVFELAPLRKSDVASAAKLSNVDAGLFVEAIIRSDVVPLAIKPITLDFLIAAFAKGGSLTAGRAALYADGLRRMCDEPNPERRESPITRPTLTADQRLSIATRVAGVTQLSNRASIWTGSAGALETEDVALESLVGGLENGVEVDLSAAREVLGTGLFSSRGLHKHGWRHLTYAEYLAALYLNTHKLDPARLRPLILHFDGSGKVIPQLRETAAWLAGMNSAVFEMLVKTDPEVLLRSDMAAAGDSNRAELAAALLKAFERDDATQTLWDLRADFSRLDNPELAMIVEPYVRDATRPEEARVAAIEMIRACRLSVLLEQLVMVALSANQALRVRNHAASTVAEIGDSGARAGLRPLAFGTADDDPKDDLKGHALAASWPDHFSAQELFAALSPIKDHSYIGSYRRFLESDIAAQLDPKNIEIALRWAQTYVRGRDQLDAMHRLASEILERAVNYIDEPGVLELLARTLFARGQAYTDCHGATTRIRSAGDTVRRAIATAMFGKASVAVHGKLTIIDVCALSPNDVPWLFDEFQKASDQKVKKLIAELIAWLIDGSDPEVLDTVLRRARDDQTLEAAIGPMVAAIRLDSQLAQQLKDHYKLRAQYQQPKPKELPPARIESRLTEALDRNDAQSFFDVYMVFRAQKGDLQSTEPLVGWSNLDESLKSQIRIAARSYARTRPRGADGEWWKRRTYTYGLMAGYMALHLMAAESPDKLDELTDSNWEFWTKLAVSYVPSGAEASTRPRLLAKAYERARATFQATLEDLLHADDETQGRTFVFSNIGDIWTDDLAGTLRTKLEGKVLKPGSFKDVLGHLLRMKDAGAEAFALQLATAPFLSEADARQRVVYSIADLLSHHPHHWKTIWPIFQANPPLGVEVLGLIASEHEFSSFATKLSEDEIAEICIWLSKLGYDKENGVDDRDEGSLVAGPVALAHWWNSLINFLTYKGTVRGCDSIRKLMAALPQYEGLKWSLREAQERMRRATWTPPSPDEVIALLGKADVRMVRNGRELLEVLTESLNRLQSELQGITPSAEDLWSELPRSKGDERLFRPKNENFLSNYVKRYLERDLRQRGLILNREVQMRAPMGGKKGEDTDIFIDVLISGIQSSESERLSAVIEVKFVGALTSTMPCGLSWRKDIWPIVGFTMACT